MFNLMAANPYAKDERLLERAGRTLNTAIEESLFEIMNELGPLFDEE